jgi:DMSO/TMAO reductase YedYZ molybdopterin-dependent catalytic subunit
MREADPKLKDRVPPGQVLTAKWPVLTFGATPRIDLGRWTFRCFGQVEKEVSWTWEEFSRLPRVEIFSDIHCVTRWSRLDNQWEGVHVREIMKRAGVGERAVAVMARSEGGYTTNIALEDLLDGDVLLATRHDGRDLEPEHGGPCRLVVPKLYFWKSAKWLRELEVLGVNSPGFWEENGYHLHADPWKEERYSDQETNAMQRLRAEAARRLKSSDRPGGENP